MGDWHKVEKHWSPCDGCQVGWGAMSSEIRNGELWTKSDDCHEECERYNDWVAGDLIHKIVTERHDALMELAKH